MNPSSETELLHAEGNKDGQTDMKELKSLFTTSLSVKQSIYLQETHKI
jgi:hypothetical protein